MSPFEVVTRLFNRAVEFLLLSDSTRAALGRSYRELTVEVVLLRDNGLRKVFTG